MTEYLVKNYSFLRKYNILCSSGKFVGENFCIKAISKKLSASPIPPALANRVFKFFWLCQKT